jgi:hypothetical protein
MDVQIDMLECTVDGTFEVAGLQCNDADRVGVGVQRLVFERPDEGLHVVWLLVQSLGKMVVILNILIVG